MLAVIYEKEREREKRDYIYGTHGTYILENKCVFTFKIETKSD